MSLLGNEASVSYRKYREALQKRAQTPGRAGHAILLAAQLDTLVKRLEQTPALRMNWPLLEKILAALPLSTADYGIARNHLANARAYLTVNEPGAARFELRRLRDCVQET